MTSSETFVIVGASLAGAKAAEALRDQGFDGNVVLIGAEAHRPYERPPLSKGYLTGTAEREASFVHPEAWYRDHGIDLRVGRTVTDLDRANRIIRLDDATTVSYDNLLLSTGSSPRTLTVPGIEAEGVHFLRTIDDCEALREVLGRVARLVVIGAGWIGLEVAAAARTARVQVTVVEAAQLPLLQVLGPEIAKVFADLHREHGVEFHFGAVLDAFEVTEDRVTGVRLGDGSVLAADAVLVGVGAAPNSALAEAAGLDVDNGIRVDAAMRTSDPHIFAVGDVANVANPFYGKHIRVEHWANALNQPAVAAASMLGHPDAYDELPYFFTDQYDLGMEYVGYVERGGYAQVVIRGDLSRREFVAFWINDGRVLAGMNVNVWDVIDQIKLLIRSRKQIDPTELADPSRDLAELAADSGG